MDYTRGERLTELMAKPENKGKNATYLGNKIGKDSAYISKLKSDTLKAADNKLLKIIAEELGSTFEWLEFGVESAVKVSFNEPVLYNRLSEDLQKYVNEADSTPYLVVGSHLKKFTKEEVFKMIERTTDEHLKFMLSGLYMNMPER